MLVNSIDISNFKAILLSKDIQTANIITYDDWLRNSLNPLFIGKQEQYKSLKVRLFIEDTNDETALNDISNIVKQFEKCILKFDYLSLYYDCLIVSKNHERIAIGRYNLEIELKGYAYKSQITEIANRVSTKTINVPGNSETPAIVEITPSIALVDLVVTGLGETFTLKNLAAGQKIIVNGEDCTVLQGSTNRFSDYDSWDFPVLSPGSNTITFSKSNCDVSIKYKPRWI
ncbi:phage distal tail protein [Clostridium intestinale]|uniref:Phage-related protein n=1 Tax=Clostridium intestinale DSM 6191 TaxID=1121320 RepID=A0A1M5TZW2_9CLOT|nr:phage tail domain-containing protein [Clostridium intestinale]SHH56140.1 Phage-related protein [Clostridium intestinale DSM 6191]